MTAVAALPDPEPEQDDLGLDETEHVEMSWHLSEMQEQLDDVRRRLQMAFPEDERYEKWCNSMAAAVGNIRAALVKNLRTTHSKTLEQAKTLYKCTSGGTR